MKKLRIFSVALLCLAALMAQAQEDHPTPVKVNNAFSIGLGSAHRADTYLSPLHYTGWSSELNYEHFHAFSRIPALWGLNVGLIVDRTENPVRNSAMLGAQFEARWTMMRRWEFGKRYQVGIGGATTLNAGALYLRRNGNNPVAANASWTADISAYGSARFKIGRMPVTALYRATLPVVGAMFAPDYGQLYYEIYLGDSNGLFTGAYWGRYFRLDQRVTVDMKVGRKWLRVGYGADILSTKVKGIVSRRIDHTFVLGITTDWLW